MDNIMKPLRALTMLLVASIICLACGFARAQTIIASDYFTKSDDHGKFEVRFANQGDNFGFTSTKPVAPVGANSGSTLGQQRVNAAMFAVDHWSDQLLSKIDVPIIMHLRFDNTLPCGVAMATSVVWMHNGTGIFIGNEHYTLVGLPQGDVANPTVAYPAALVHQLFGQRIEDANTGIEADFYITIPEKNDSGTCANKFHYGISGNSDPLRTDFFRAILHEIAHGLGFASSLRSDGSGSYSSNGFPSSFDAQLWDIASDKPFVQLPAQAREASLSRTRGVAFVGGSTATAIEAYLSPGVAQLRITAHGLSRNRDVQSPIYVAVPQGLGPAPTARLSNQGPTQLRDMSVVWNACDPSWSQGNRLQGRIAFVLFPGYPSCPVDVQIHAMQVAGAVAVLFGTYPAQADFTEFGNVKVSISADGSFTVESAPRTVPNLNIPSARIMAYEDMAELLSALWFTGVGTPAPPPPNTPEPMKDILKRTFEGQEAAMLSFFSDAFPLNSEVKAEIHEMERNGLAVSVELGVNPYQYQGSVLLPRKQFADTQGIDDSSLFRHAMLVHTSARFDPDSNKLPVVYGSVLDHWDSMAKHRQQGAGVLMRYSADDSKPELIAPEFQWTTDFTYSALLDIGWRYVP